MPRKNNDFKELEEAVIASAKALHDNSEPENTGDMDLRKIGRVNKMLQDGTISEEEASHIDYRTANSQKKEQIPLKLIKPGENIRDENLEEDPDTIELAYSIATNGMKTSLTVYADGDDYILLHGYRRFTAINMILNHSTLPSPESDEEIEITKEMRERLASIYCDIVPKPKNDIERMKDQGIDNNKRKDLDNFGWANLVYSLKERGAKQVDIAAWYGKTKSLISDYLIVRKISENIKLILKQIQKYDCSKAFLEKSSTGRTFKPKSNIIGIKQLRAIARADNQAMEFWRRYGHVCTEEDAIFIGLDPKILEKKEKELSKEEKTVRFFERVVKELQKSIVLFKSEDSIKKSKGGEQLIALLTNIIDNAGEILESLR